MEVGEFMEFMSARKSPCLRVVGRWKVDESEYVQPNHLSAEVSCWTYVVRSNGVNLFNVVREGSSFVGDQLDEFVRGRFASQKRKFIPYCSSPSYNYSSGNLY